ncbi:terpene synthase family protein [Streptomyces vinaceus]|uniref:terpene synthase family protein n=1 Tax=Streptomyces vinaceus TaxID=1960 RepID=UPI0037FEEED8
MSSLIPGEKAGLLRITESLVIPRVRVPYPHRVNPHLKQIRDESNAWVLSFGTYRNDAERRLFTDMDLPYLSAMCWSHSSADRFRLITDINSMMAVRDDEFDDEKNSAREELIAAELAFLRKEGRRQETKWTPLWRDIAERLPAHMPPPVVDRFLWRVDQYLETCLNVAVRLREGRDYPMTEYIADRRHTVGCYFVDVLAQADLDLDMSDSLATSDLVQEIEDVNNDCVWLLEDLYSCRKELASGRRDNIVSRIAEDTGCSLQEAVDRTAAMLRTALRRFDQVLSDLEDPDTEDARTVHAYAQGLRLVIPACLEYLDQSARYHPERYLEVEL